MTGNERHLTTRHRNRILLSVACLLFSGLAFCKASDAEELYVWRRQGLVLREAARVDGKPLAKVDFGARVEARTTWPEGRPALLDGVRGAWRAVRTEQGDGYLLASFLTRLPPPPACESFANFLLELEASVGRDGSPVTEYEGPEMSEPGRDDLVVDLDVAPGADTHPETTARERRRRVTTQYNKGIRVIDEESPRFASIAIIIEDFPGPAAFLLAQMCNPHFFPNAPYPRRALRRERTGDFTKSTDIARFNPSGLPVLFENRTETDEHLEKTTVHPLENGAVRIKYYFGSL